jgi:hypothetical protein
VRITTRTNIKGNKVFCFDKSHHGSLIDTFKERCHRSCRLADYKYCAIVSMGLSRIASRLAWNRLSSSSLTGTFIASMAVEGRDIIDDGGPGGFLIIDGSIGRG